MSAHLNLIDINIVCHHIIFAHEYIIRLNAMLRDLNSKSEITFHHEYSHTKYMMIIIALYSIIFQPMIIIPHEI